MQEAVASFVPDGQELLIGGFAFSDPFAFAHELIRQRRQDLRVFKGSGGVLVDQLIGAGCLSGLAFSHVWNSVGPSPAHCFRRAIEGGGTQQLALEEMSYGVFTSRLIAGACGFEFMPTTPVAGSGQFRTGPNPARTVGLVKSPFDGRTVTVASPMKPKLGVFHVQRADRFGNGQLFGPSAETRFAAAACERIVLVTEELVETGLIRERPELTAIPGFLVSAIVVEPWGAHPTDSYGYYSRDLAHHQLYADRSSSIEGFMDYLNEWILGTSDHREFCRKLGDDRLRQLRTRSEPW